MSETTTTPPEELRNFITAARDGGYCWIVYDPGFDKASIDWPKVGAVFRTSPVPRGRVWAVLERDRADALKAQLGPAAIILGVDDVKPAPSDILLPIPMRNSYWRHNRTQNLYVVKYVTNLHADDHEKFPILVVYEDTIRRVWSRPLAAFVEKFTDLGRNA
jgi:hypothetical protein